MQCDVFKERGNVKADTFKFTRGPRVHLVTAMAGTRHLLPQTNTHAEPWWATLQKGGSHMK